RAPQERGWKGQARHATWRGASKVGCPWAYTDHVRVVTLWQHGEAGSVGWTDGSCLLSCPSCGGSRSLCHHGGRRRLASDLPALWHAASTTAADRQAIIRQLSERVVITVQGESAKIAVQGHWLGGYGTQTTLIRPGARLDQLSYDPDWLA